MTSLKSQFHFFRVVLVVLFALGAQVAHAEETINLTIGVKQPEIITLTQDVSTVQIKNHSVAYVIKHSNQKISIVGKKAGNTDIHLVGADKQIFRTYHLTVIQNISSIKQSLHSLFPTENIGVEKINHSLALTGTVSSTEVAAQAIKVAGQFVPEANIVNLMKLRSGQQVMLRVHVGELKRDVLGKFGLGLQGIISAGPTVLGSLERDQAFKTLAEPTLTAISGQSAQFLAGGEFPVPVSQSGTVAVDYKSFGVSVNFTPTVINEKRLRLDVSSEVSELSSAGAVTISSMKIPGISTRRANTTVELAPGESFMIAGLMRNDYHANINEVPGLGEVPILNALFRSASFQRNESELVIAVTPYLVDPYEGQNVRLPTDNLQSPSTMDLMFTGSLGRFQNQQPTQGDSIQMEGPTGFIID
jgi:pilus assembly protein CpaC